MAKIHPTAVVDPGAKIHDDAVVGPLSVVDGEVELGADTEIGPHVYVTGKTRIGARTRVYPFSVLGGAPQMLGFDGRTTELVIGEGNTIREHASIHVGTPKGGGRTKIGDNNLIMNNFHIAHDCQIGNHCVLAGYSGMGGHVILEDFVVIGGMTGIHQFVRIGCYAFTAGNSMVSKDVPPYAKVAGDRARFVGVNHINLERLGFDRERIALIKHAFHVLFQSKLRFAEACDRVESECGGSADVLHLLEFLRSSERGFIR
ncbi:MAG: acyl-ACP--UDP-N-acetylglucosamine O-acyltransferase [Myxococcales bacterium]|nr:acyl-ACP--UDP-N-acetylglucosamine O-acyltransferase [Myxococcales bacterium]